MPLPSPRDIAEKARTAYPRFLREWVHGRGDAFFPHRVRLRLSIAPQDVKGTLAALGN